MKNIIAYLITILGLAGLSACGPQLTTRTSLLVDVSEADGAVIEINDTNTIGYPKSMWDGSIVRYSELKDLVFTEQMTFEIMPAEEYLSNTGQRNHELQGFKEKLKKLVTHDTVTYNYSYIWIPLMNELIYLSEDTTIPTTLYLVSDLLEHTPDWISMYDPTTIKMLENNPNQLQAKFQAKMPKKGSYKHISLVIVHTPKDAQENVIFMRMVNQIYKPLVESKGMRFSVQAKL